MCAYKLCRVEFKYWGMQAKIERFIHDIGNVLDLVTVRVVLNNYSMVHPDSSTEDDGSCSSSGVDVAR